jgi:hypothetical protein
MERIGRIKADLDTDFQDAQDFLCQSPNRLIA